MTCFRSPKSSRVGRFCLSLTAIAGLGTAVLARADLPGWQQAVASASAIEAALFRVMQLPGAAVSYPRPPEEAAAELGKLLSADPGKPELVALRARSEEQALDFAAAEKDWTAFAAQAPDRAAANGELADFYARRLQGAQEIAALEAAAKVPATPAEAFLPADQQAAWQAFVRALAVARKQALGDDAQLAIYTAWIARYPNEPAARANAIVAMLRLKRVAEANAAIAGYRQAFPEDTAFPVKASAVAAAESGGPDAAARALAIFDAAYQPLWSAELAQSYFALLNATHSEHTMLAKARAALARNPDDLPAVTRIFAYFQQAGRTDAAAEALAQYRASKDARHAPWTADELYAFGTLLGGAGLDEEAVRYEFALAGSPGPTHFSPEPTEQLALVNTISLLLTGADRPIALGAGNLSVYRDLATVDTGPGYWNGVLSLWLNSTSPAAEMDKEEANATPYFHRAKAAELLAVLDKRFPRAPERDSLHAALIHAYLTYGEDRAAIAAGTRFLADFPKSDSHLDIALAVADADARQNDTEAEFALYDSLLRTLAGSLHGMPLTAAGQAAADSPQAAPPVATPDATVNGTDADNATDNDTETTGTAETSSPTPPSTPKLTPAEVLLSTLQAPVRSPETAGTAGVYRQVLERYLGRLTATHQLPAALTVLRHELDRNPNDPLLYDRLASFLAQNDLSAQEEQVYQAAIQRFNSPGLYDKLARFYVRQKRRNDFAALTRKVTGIFSNTELESYFSNVNRNWPQLYLQLNLYAHQRFPHDLRFTRNLLTAYRAKGTADPVAWDKLLREHWWEAADLQREFFEHLSRTHKLAAELAQLEQLAPPGGAPATNLAATRELAELDLWRSHFEESAPRLLLVAKAYPAETGVGDEAASLLRSLAYRDPGKLDQAVAIQKNLAAAEPANLDRLAAIGDTYANSTSPELGLSAPAQLARAEPYWTRMATVQRGEPDGYLQSATVFWDYFEFDRALSQLQAARQQFGKTTLYGFEAGALEEDMGKPALAAEEYARAAAADLEQAPNPADAASPDETTDASGSPPSSGDDQTAEGRLLVLARRSATASMVDGATAKVLHETGTLGALEVRVDVLRAQRRQAEIAAAVEGQVGAATTAEQLVDLAAYSERQHLPRARQQALSREVGLAADPVERIELQYQLVAAYDETNDTAAAQRVIEAVYAADPKILGVVRSTVDFYWNHKQPARAVRTLEQAAAQANPALSHQFTLEAIAKSNSSADYAGARTLLRPLLAAEPFNPQYISLQADSYARAYDNAGLRDFYAGTIKALQSSSLPTGEKRAHLAEARQGMIPALTALKDYAGATDQYIALLQGFPEDANLVETAALYARRYGQQPRLLGFLNGAVADSPRDSRFAIDLGRTDELLGDYDGALAAYTKAIAIRQDRPDLYIARAALEEHRQDFEAACADYARLFTLSYDDPQWMEKAALARVRQGKPDLAVKALEAAWITNRPVSAANPFRVAAQLQQWDLLPEARTYAERGIALAGDGLLGDPQFADGVRTYVTILARQRNAAEVLTRLLAWSGSAHVSPASPALVSEQVQQEALAALTDAQWRALRSQRRDEQARRTLMSSLAALGDAVATFYTPEEKLGYARLLDARRANASNSDVLGLWIPAAHGAGLFDREAAWRRDLLLAGKGGPGQYQGFVDLEQRRLDLATLASTLDRYAGRQKPATQANTLSTAVEAWRGAGDTPHELAELRALAVDRAQTQWQDRLFRLLLATDPQALLALAAANAPYSDAAANFALANGSRELAYKAIAARAEGLVPVWGTTNTALAGLYFREVSAGTDTAFRSALDEKTIGARLAARPDPAHALTGNLWFALGSRYGVYRTLAPAANADPEDYLAAGLEGAANDPSAYTRLAHTYLDAGEREPALAEFRHALELDPTDPAPNVAIAEELWTAGRHDEALAAWRAALVQLRALIEERSVPETFWTSFSAIATDIRDDSLQAQLDAGLGGVLGDYLRKNDAYRATEVLGDVYRSQERRGEPAAAAYVLGFLSAAGSERALLNELQSSPWFPKSQLGSVYRRELALAPPSTGATAEQAGGSSELDLIRSQYLNWLIEQNQVAAAQQFFDSLPAPERTSAAFAVPRIQLAAKQGQLPELIAQWIADPDNAPDLSTVSNVAEQLRGNKDLPGSRALLEYAFTRKQNEDSLRDSDYLALAEARLATADTPGALDLLHRFTLQADDFYAALDSAAALLTRTGHNAEALPFLTRLANGTPWDASARQRLGMAELAAGDKPAAAEALGKVAAAIDAPYAPRAESATALRDLPGSHTFPSAELTLLASPGPITSQAADQPYFTYARLAAATTAPPAAGAHLLLAAVAVAPDTLLSRLELPLFYAQLKAGHDNQARAAIQPLLTRYPDLTQVYAGTLTSFHSYTPYCGGPDCPPPSPTVPLVLDEAARRDLLLALATMHERLHEPTEAVGVLDAAANLGTDQERAAVKARLAQLNDRLAREQENGARRPVLQATLADSSNVRPMLLPGSPLPHAPATEVQP